MKVKYNNQGHSVPCLRQVTVSTAQFSPRQLANVSPIIDYIACCALGHLCEVSSSPRPWIDVFALPEKCNMAVTERDLDPKVRLHNFVMTVRAVSWACGHVTEMSLILRKNYFGHEYLGTSLKYDRQKKCPTILCGVNLWLRHVSSTGLISVHIHTKLGQESLQKVMGMTINIA